MTSSIGMYIRKEEESIFTVFKKLYQPFCSSIWLLQDALIQDLKLHCYILHYFGCLT